ncbi:alpha/beta hydrolase domain-containing protein VTE7-like isoform X2 [Rhododendron vialii]|uniref:alpha/beta hydrolase domain-containing protein VTE7-like isoform X2 n=1 Tax=Rhododendron vialii TaxID=182163 RepID=UPI00265D65A9|nr:alpha/beta hydrolase domain-containing protein VTE7-like isoform X2 [Rhododendron vialii]
MVGLMMAGLTLGFFPVIRGKRMECGGGKLMHVRASSGFPSFLPKEVHQIKDPFARTLAQRIQRLPVQIGFSGSCIMSSCVKPIRQQETDPVVLLHCFDSSCLEWRRAYPLLEDAGLEVWAVDVLGWGFSDLEVLPPCDPATKRYHLYQVKKLVLINPSVYAEGTGLTAKLPRMMAYAMVLLLKSMPLRLYATFLMFDGIPFTTRLDWTNVGRLHSLLPWWEDATVDYILSGGYNVAAQIKQVKQTALVVWGECDNIVSNKLAMRLFCELAPNSRMRQIPDCGHLPHVEKPEAVAELIADFSRGDSCETEPNPLACGVDGVCVVDA